MRGKQLWNALPVPRYVVAHIYETITRTRFTFFYTLILLLSTVTLVALQLSSYRTNASADDTLSALIKAGEIQPSLIPIVATNQEGDSVLQLCNGIPSSNEDSRCQTVFIPGSTSTEVPSIGVGNKPTQTAQESPSPTPTEVLTGPTQIPDQANTSPTATNILPVITESTGQDSLVADQPTSTTSLNATEVSLGIAGLVDLTTTTTSEVPIPTEDLEQKLDLETVNATTTIAESLETPVGTDVEEESEVVAPTSTEEIVITSSTSEEVELPTSISFETTGTPIIISEVLDPVSTSIEGATNTSAVEVTATLVDGGISTTEEAFIVPSEAPSTETAIETVPSTDEAPTSTSTTDDSTSISTTATVSATTRLAVASAIESTLVASETIPTILSSSSEEFTSTPISTRREATSTSSRIEAASTSVQITPTFIEFTSTSFGTENTLETSVATANAITATVTEDAKATVDPTLQNLPEIEGSTSFQSVPGLEFDQDSVSLRPLPEILGRLKRHLKEKRRSGAVLRRGLNAVPVINGTTGIVVGVNVTNLDGSANGEVTSLGLACVGGLRLGEEQLHESWTEDLVMVGYHIWLAGLGIMAILNESIPHLIATFISTLLALIWSGAEMAETRAFQSEFDSLVTNGVCNGIELLPSYWRQRQKLDIGVFVLNAVSALVLGGLGSKLVAVYRKRMTVRVGEGQERRVYKKILLLSIIIQIGAFMQLASLSVWAQQLFISPISGYSPSRQPFKVLTLFSILLTISWLTVGYLAIRHERKLLMIIFCAIDVFFIGEWIVFFASDIYRLIFVKWAFFAAGTVGAFALLVGCLIAGILGWMHFGRGVLDKLEESSKDVVDKTPWEFSNTAEKAWEPFERNVDRQSRFTSITRSSSDRQSMAFSYGLRTPMPPMPSARPEMNSRFSQ